MTLPLAANAGTLWKGDFSSSDLSQWSKVERVAASRIKVVADGDGGKAGRFLVKQGDDPINASGNRNELVYVGDKITEGAERWYSWNTLWPDSFKSAPTWQLFTQWHHTGTSGSPPIEFFTNREQILLRVNQKQVWSTPLTRGLWHWFVLHVKWSSNASKGYVEVYYDGKPVLRRLVTKTLYAGQGVYLKQGLYRKDTITYDQVIYHRRTRIQNSSPLTPTSVLPKVGASTLGAAIPLALVLPLAQALLPDAVNAAASAEGSVAVDDADMVNEEDAATVQEALDIQATAAPLTPLPDEPAAEELSAKNAGYYEDAEGNLVGVGQGAGCASAGASISALAALVLPFTRRKRRRTCA